MNIINLAFLLVFQFSLSFDRALESPQSSPLPDSQQKQQKDRAGATNIIFKSTDGGQTWKDISEGLPEISPRDAFFANDNGFYLRAGNGIYHSIPNSAAPYWKKEVFPNDRSNIAAGNTRMFAYYYNGQFLRRKNGESIWPPMYANFQQADIRTVFETAGGTVFIGCYNGFFRSADNGKTWKQVRSGGWMSNLVESNGILMATSQWGILRSTDDGESWDYVIREGGVGISIERIDGGVAAITFNTASKTRRVRISYDGGSTWQAIDAGLPPSMLISSIIQVGDNFFCGHPDGIFRSSDKGKTWKLILPSIEDKVFNLSVSGNVIYAIPRPGGC